MHNAILIIGPTGSGKTPLGNTLERRGLWNQHCCHFDFGHQLRRTAAAAANPLLTPDELHIIRQLLRTGALLEDEQFPIARKILLAFLRDRCSFDDNNIVILNGLPRHLGQAADIDHIVRVTLLIHLICTPGTILQRLRTNAGGDRGGRVDDSLAIVRRKLATFERRTKPLIEHYHSLSIPIIEHPVTPADKPDLLWPRINRLAP